MEPRPTNAHDVNLFAVSPKEDCPHQETLQYPDISYALTKETLTAPCKNCQSTQENWVCLTCKEIFCSRYSNSHMVKHNEESKHPVALSLSDGSFWCYACDSYVYSKDLHALAIKFSKLKFPESKGGMLDLDVLAKEFAGIDASLRVEEKEETKNFSRTALVQGFRNKIFKKIIFLTGAGISVSAGIPDFRSETGLYAQLGECNLPYPEEIFEVGYFKEHPETFYKLAKVLMSFKAKPTLAHYFIKMLADLELLNLNFTQNVDGLEVEAGLDLKYLIEAHGHIRSAHCAKCQKEKPIDELKQHIQDGKIYRCECTGPVKPDIIFFGEQLPANFFLSFQKIMEADLVIVMGTSLRVFPFASLVQAVPKEVPIVLINRENTGISRDKFLFLQGDIDEIVGELVKEIGWENHLQALQKS